MKIMDENNNFYTVDGPYRIRDEKVAYYFLEDDHTWEKTLVAVKTFIVNTSGESPKWKVLEESKYGGCMHPLHLLPVGTRFFVHNGHWTGYITEKDGVKGLVVEGDETFHPLRTTGEDDMAITVMVK